MLILAYAIVSTALLLGLGRSTAGVLASPAGRRMPITAVILTFVLWVALNSGLYWAEIQVFKSLGLV